MRLTARGLRVEPSSNSSHFTATPRAMPSLNKCFQTMDMLPRPTFSPQSGQNRRILLYLTTDEAELSERRN